MILDFSGGAAPVARARFGAVSTDNLTNESMIRKAPVDPVEWSIADFMFVQMWKHAHLDVLSGIPGFTLA
jgi:hypothetical protein